MVLQLHIGAQHLIKPVNAVLRHLVTAHFFDIVHLPLRHIHFESVKLLPPSELTLRQLPRFFLLSARFAAVYAALSL